MEYLLEVFKARAGKCNGPHDLDCDCNIYKRLKEVEPEELDEDRCIFCDKGDCDECDRPEGGELEDTLIENRKLRKQLAECRCAEHDAANTKMEKYAKQRDSFKSELGKVQYDFMNFRDAANARVAVLGEALCASEALVLVYREEIDRLAKDFGQGVKGSIRRIWNYAVSAHKANEKARADIANKE